MTWQLALAAASSFAAGILVGWWSWRSGYRAGERAGMAMYREHE
jgi:hypothetical protein